MTESVPSADRVRDLEAFIAAISRELSNPLAPVLLAVERLRSTLAVGDPAQSEAALALVERAADAFARRSRMLLDLADITAGITCVAPAPLSLPPFLESVVARHAEMARRAGCFLALDADHGLQVLADAPALAQVLDTLLANALRFGAGRPVHVLARPLASERAASNRCVGDSRMVVISVIDQGPGVSPEDATRIFGLFQRPRGMLEPGLGIGLCVAAGLVSAMGGDIGCDSTRESAENACAEGSGAHFHVSLPCPEPPCVARQVENLQMP